MDPSKRPSTLILQMDTTERQVCSNAGGDTLMQGEDVETILKISRNYFQPDAPVHANRQVKKLLQ